MKTIKSTQTQAELRERALRCARFGGVITGHGFQIVYDETLAGPDGMDYILFREPQHTQEHINKAVAKLRRDFDVVHIYEKNLEQPLF